MVGAWTWITVILNGLLWKWIEIIPLFLRLYPSTAFWTLADYKGYCISCKGFLPTIVDTMVMRITFAHSGDFSSLIPKKLMFILAIPCLTNSNLAWFMDLTLHVLMQYCSLYHWTLLYHQTHLYLGVVSTLPQLLHLFWSYFFHSSPVAYWCYFHLFSSSRKI